MIQEKLFWQTSCWDGGQFYKHELGYLLSCGGFLGHSTWLTETAYKDSGNLLKPYGTHTTPDKKLFDSKRDDRLWLIGYEDIKL